MERKISAANELLENLKAKGFVASAPVNVDEIANKLGIKVIYDSSLGTDVVGKIEYDNEGKPVVSINPSENSFEPRRRFTLAHEIAHFCLHSSSSSGFLDTKKNMSRSGSYWDSYESESNAFAAQLLMPQKLLAEKYAEIMAKLKDSYGDVSLPSSLLVDLLAKAFKVSNKAMEYRLKNLGVI